MLALPPLREIRIAPPARKCESPTSGTWIRSDADSADADALDTSDAVTLGTSASSADAVKSMKHTFLRGGAWSPVG